VAEASDALAGSIVTCPDCHTQMTVPSAVPLPDPGPKFVTAVPIAVASRPVRRDGKVRFLCPSCNKRLRAPSLAVGTVTVCRRCGQRMEVPPPRGGDEPPPVNALPQARTPSEYYYVRDNQRHGPVYAHELKKLAEAGQLLPTDLIWKRGMAQWTPAVLLRNLFRGITPPPLPTEPPPLPEPASPRGPATPVPVTPSGPMPTPASYAPNRPAASPRVPPAPQVSPLAAGPGPRAPVAPVASPRVGPAPPLPAASAPRQPVPPVAPARPTPAPTPAVAAAVPPSRTPSVADLDRTIAAWSETLRLDPRNVSARINRGMAHAEKGDYDRAVADLTEAVRLDPRNAQAYASRGVIHAQMRVDYARGIADLSRAIQLAPDEVILYEFRAIFHRATGDTARAAEDERKAAELRPRGTLSNLRLGPAAHLTR
jgi:hypothetical protein